METDKTLKEFFSGSLVKFADRPAISCFRDSLSYGEVDLLSSAFAAYLRVNLGLQPGDKLAIQLPNLLQYPVVILAAIKAGLVIVNTNPLYTQKELLHQLNDAQVKAVVLLSSLSGNLAQILPETAIEHVIVTQVGDLLSPPKRLMLNTVLNFKALFSSQPQLNTSISFLAALEAGKGQQIPASTTSAESLALLQYTGGTTGPSKGAMLSHRNLLNNLAQIKTSLEGSFQEGKEIVVTPLPIYHIFSFTVCILFGFSIGAQLILIPDPRNTKRLIADIKDSKFTFFVGLNTLFNSLCAHKAFKGVDFSHLGITISGGMALLKKTAATWEKVTGSKVVEGYGLTEASPVITLNPFDAPKLGTVGKFVANTERRFIDADGKDLALGEAGELLLRGPQIMSGYWQQAEASANTIDHEGWLHTGDVAVEDADGYLSIVERIKDMVVVSGFNVYPNELEDEISKHPDIRECAVIGVADPNTVEAIKIFVVTTNSDLSEKAVQDFARLSLAAYKIPKYVEFIVELPKSNVGKVLRRELRD